MYTYVYINTVIHAQHPTPQAIVDSLDRFFMMLQRCCPFVMDETKVLVISQILRKQIWPHIAKTQETHAWSRQNLAKLTE